MTRLQWWSRVEQCWYWLDTSHGIFISALPQRFVLSPNKFDFSYYNLEAEGFVLIWQYRVSEIIWTCPSMSFFYVVLATRKPLLNLFYFHFRVVRNSYSIWTIVLFVPFLTFVLSVICSPNPAHTQGFLCWTHHLDKRRCKMLLATLPSAKVIRHEAGKAKRHVSV